jgi:hypothetical protein
MSAHDGKSDKGDPFEPADAIVVRNPGKTKTKNKSEGKEKEKTKKYVSIGLNSRLKR